MVSGLDIDGTRAERTSDLDCRKLFIKGVPDAVGDYALSFSGNFGGVLSLKVHVKEAKDAPIIAISPNTLPEGHEGLPYAAQSLTVSGGTAPYQLTVDNLPGGLKSTTDAAHGQIRISGTPSGVVSGRPFTVKAIDALGYEKSFPVTLNVQKAAALSISPNTLPEGHEGLPYAAQSLTVSGGTAPYQLTVDNLPGGLKSTTDAAHGQIRISGTPSGVVSGRPFTVKAIDALGYEKSFPVTLNVQKAAALSISPNTLPEGHEGLPYAAQSLTVSGGTAPYQLTVDNLPGGLKSTTDAAHGQIRISGTPSGVVSGRPFTVKAIDALGYEKSFPVTLNVQKAAALSISPNTLPEGHEGLPYAAQSLTVSGGTAPYQLTVDNLPGGLKSTTDAAHGQIRISGTPSGVVSGRPFTVKAIDALGYEKSFPVTLNVQKAAALSISPNTLPEGHEGLPYAAQSLTVSGGTAPYQLTVDNLPGGLKSTTDAAHGQIRISGTPSGVVSGRPFTVKAIDALGYEKSFPVTLNVQKAAALSISPNTLPEGHEGLPYAAQSLTVSGGTAPYQLTVDNLPGGLKSTTDAAHGQIRISGTPSGVVSGRPFTVKAIDALGYEKSFPVTLNVQKAAALSISPNTLPEGHEGLPYAAQSLTVSGGTAPYQLTVDNLPGGLKSTTDAAHGQIRISGTPSGVVSGRPFTVKAIDALGYEKSFPVTLNVQKAAALRIMPVSLPQAAFGETYEQTLTATGGAAASGGEVSYRFDFVGSHPAWLKLDGGTGKLSGTPTKADSDNGYVTFTIQASDGIGYKGTREYTLDIVYARIIEVLPEKLPDGGAKLPYNVALDAKGGTAPYRYKVLDRDNLPPGISFDEKSGKISGTPTREGTYSVLIGATDADGIGGDENGDGNGWKEYTFMIAAAPHLVITPQQDKLPQGHEKLAYALQLGAAGGTPPYTFAISGNALPNGLLLKEGKISGVPAKAGTYSFTVTVSDHKGYKEEHAYALEITQPLIEAKPHALQVLAGTTAGIDLTTGAVGGPFTGAQIVSLANPAAGDAWIESAGNGSQMLYFNASPTFAGTTHLIYTLSNAAATSAPAKVTVTVIPRPDPSKDPEVIGLVNAQVETTKRLTQIQMRNFEQRLEQLHDQGECRKNAIGANVGLEDAQLHPNLDQSVRTECSSLQNRLSLWTNGSVDYGRSGDDDNPEKHSQRHVSIGMSGGFDYRFTPSFIGGVGFGYGRDVTDIGQNGTRSRGSLFTMAAYGSYSAGKGIFLDGIIGYGWLHFNNNRYVTVTGAVAQGERDGQQIFGATSLGYEYRNGQWMLSPYMRADMAHGWVDEYSETGGGIYSLTYGQQTIDLFTTTMGMRAEYTIPMDWGQLKPRGRLEYIRDFSGNSRAMLGYTDIGGVLPYTIEAKDDALDSIKVELGVDVGIGDELSTSLDYSTTISAHQANLRHRLALEIDKKF